MRKVLLFLCLFFLSFGSLCHGAILNDAQKPEEYTLVNDFAAVMTKEQVDAMEKDLRYIVDHQKKGAAQQLRLYFFTTDAKSGGIAGAEKKLLGNAKIDPSITPVLMLYDKNTKKVAIVADERIETFISKQYVQSLFVGRSDPLTAEDFHEIGVRLSTTLILVMENGLIRQEGVPSKEQISPTVDIKFANFSQYMRQKTEDTPTEAPKKQEDSGGLPVPIILLSILISAAALYRKFISMQKAKMGKERPAE